MLIIPFEVYGSVRNEKFPMLRISLDFGSHIKKLVYFSILNCLHYTTKALSILRFRQSRSQQLRRELCFLPMFLMGLSYIAVTSFSFILGSLCRQCNEYI